MTTPAPRCTCPQSTNSRGEPVRYTDQLCAVHGRKPLPKQRVHQNCKSCTCEEPEVRGEE